MGAGEALSERGSGHACVRMKTNSIIRVAHGDVCADQYVINT